MSRPTRQRVVYTALVAIGVIAGFALYSSSHHGGLFLTLMVVLLLIPGRLQALLWREFFHARRLLAAGRLEDATKLSERFLQRVAENPRLKKVIWLGGWVYTFDVEAMAYYNLGVGRLCLGDFAAAKEAFENALRIDPLYALPYANLGVIAVIQGDDAGAERFADKSRALGYSQATTKQIHASAERIVSALERCDKCGYCLKGNVSGRCPECGAQTGNSYQRRQ